MSSEQWNGSLEKFWVFLQRVLNWREYKTVRSFLHICLNLHNLGNVQFFCGKSKPRMLHGNGSEGKLICVCSSSPRHKCALISLLQHSQILRQILSSDWFETKFGHMAKKHRRKWEQSLGPASLIEALVLRKKIPFLRSSFYVCVAIMSWQIVNSTLWAAEQAFYFSVQLLEQCDLYNVG